jgi:hypothetical protein
VKPISFSIHHINVSSSQSVSNINAPRRFRVFSSDDASSESVLLGDFEYQAEVQGQYRESVQEFICKLDQ